MMACETKMFKLKLKKPALVFYVVIVLMTATVISGFGFGGLNQRATAATSSTINFQARLMTNAGAIVPDGNYNIEFKLYNASTSSGSSQGSCTGDGNCLWTETRTGGNQVRVANGYLTVNLGSVTAFGNINWDQSMWLTMNVGGTGSPSWNGEMSPRLTLTATPYAFSAGQLANTNGANRSTVTWTTQTASNSILIPNEAGTLCIQGSSNCGFLTTTTANAGYIQLQATTPGSAQTGNFNITGTGIAGTLQAPTIYGNTLDSVSSGGSISIGTTNATAGITLAQNTSVTSGKTFTTNGDTKVKDTSSTAFQIQNAAGSSTYFNVDTSAGRVSIGAASASYTLDVVGDVNTSTQYRIGGTVVCTSSGCTPASGSNNYIQNTTSASVQTATFAIQSTSINTTTAVIKVLSGQNNDALDIQDPAGNPIAGIESSGAIFSAPSGTSIPGNARLFVQPLSASSTAIIARAAASATGDIIDAQDSTGTNTMFSVGATGNVAIKPTTNSTSALQVQNSNGITVLGVDTTATTNLLSNPDFDVNTTGWTNTTNGAIARQTSSSNSYEGANSAQITTTGTGGGMKTNGTAGFASGTAPAAGTYTLSFYAKLSSATFTTLAAGYNQGASDVPCTLNSNTVLTTGFQRYSCTFTSTGTMSYVYVTQTDITGRIFYVDALQLQTGSSATPYQIGGVQLRGIVTNPVSLQGSADSTNAFQIQNAAGTSNLFVADTLNSRIGIGTSAPAYTLDVGGQINTSVGLSIGGTSVCDTSVSTGCVAKSGSGFYIHNQSTVQTSASFFIQGGSSTVTGVLEANGADILDLKNSSAVNVATFGATGSVLLKTSTDSTSAFQVQQNGSSTPVLNVDTTNARVGIGQATPTRLFDIAQNSSQITAPMELLEQNGTGDATIELKSATSGTSFYVGQDTSNSGAFTVNSSTAAASNGITYVQGTSGQNDTAATTIAASYPSNVSANNLLAVAVTWSTTVNTNTLSCGDTLSNTWTTTASIFSTNAGQQTAICWAITSSSGSDTVTATISGGIGKNYRRIVLGEYHNVATSSPVDVSAVSANNASSTIGASGATTASATTTQSGDLLFGANEDTGNAGNSTVTAGSGFTQRQLTDDTVNGSNDHFSVQDKVQTSPATVAGTWGETVSGNFYTAGMVAFKPVAATITDTFNNSLFTLSQSGAAKFINSTNSTSAFVIQNASGTQLFGVDSTNGYISIGNGATGSTTPTLLVLNSKTTSGDPGTGVEGAMYYNAATKSFRCYFNAAWHPCAGGAVYSQTGIPSGDSIANTTTLTPFTESYTIPGNDCVSGRHYRLQAGGIYTTAATGTNTIILTLKMGSTVLVATPATTLTNSIAASSAVSWNFSADIQCYVGNPNATGNINAQASETVATNTSGSAVTTSLAPDSNANVNGFVTLNTTTSQAVTLNATWGVASTQNIIQLRQFTLEALGP